MFNVAVLLACLACGGHARRVVKPSTRKLALSKNAHSGSHVETQKPQQTVEESLNEPVGATGTEHTLKVLATLLLADEPTAFHMAGTGHLVNDFARRAASPLLEDSVQNIPSSVPNFRDIGGMETANGVIKPGVLLRSADPGNISKADANALEVQTVLDLRSEKDAKKTGGARRLASKTKHLELLGHKKVTRGIMKRGMEQHPKLLAEIATLYALKKVSPSRRLQNRLGNSVDKRVAKLFATVSLCDTYEFMVEQNGDDLVEAFSLIDEKSLPLLVHCTHGKDRTGVFFALLLTALGVSEDDIVQDYARSHEFGSSPEGKAAMRAAFPEKLVDKLPPNLIDDWCEAPEAELRELFRRIEGTYGSVNGYLDSIGIDESFRQRLASHLTMDSEELEQNSEQHAEENADSEELEQNSEQHAEENAGA